MFYNIYWMKRDRKSFNNNNHGCGYKRDWLLATSNKQLANCVFKSKMYFSSLAHDLI